jgi:hypothetical protein
MPAARRARAGWPGDATEVSARDLQRGSPRCDESSGCALLDAHQVIGQGRTLGAERRSLQEGAIRFE